MDSTVLTLIGLVVVGFATGALYFQGLWLTVRGFNAKSAWITRFLGSFVLRASVVVAVFYLLMDNDWRRVFALTIGFLVARHIMVKRIKKLPAETTSEQGL